MVTVFKRIRKFYDTINNGPEITDKAAYRAWLGDVLDIGDWLADKTPTEVDDQAVDFLRRIKANDRDWNVGHGLLLLLLENDELLVGTDPALLAAMPDDIKDAVADLAEVLAMDGDDANDVSMPLVLTPAIEAAKLLRSR